MGEKRDLAGGSRYPQLGHRGEGLLWYGWSLRQHTVRRGREERRWWQSSPDPSPAPAKEKASWWSRVAQDPQPRDLCHATSWRRSVYWAELYSEGDEDWRKTFQATSGRTLRLRQRPAEPSAVVFPLRRPARPAVSACGGDRSRDPLHLLCFSATSPILRQCLLHLTSTELAVHTVLPGIGRFPIPSAGEIPIPPIFPISPISPSPPPPSPSSPATAQAQGLRLAAGTGRRRRRKRSAAAPPPPAGGQRPPPPSLGAPYPTG